MTENLLRTRLQRSLKSPNPRWPTSYVTVERSLWGHRTPQPPNFRLSTFTSDGCISYESGQLPHTRNFLVALNPREVEFAMDLYSVL